MPQPSSWVSWRTWRVPDQPSKTLLLQQQTGEFLLLEDFASDYWDFLSQRPDNWLAMSQKLDLPEADLIEFAQELATAGLVTFQATHGANGSDIQQHRSVLVAEISSDLEREMMDWTAQQGFVYAAHWEITYRCNELCVHCYNPGAAHTADESPRRETDELNTQEARKLLDELVELGVFRLTLSGGEATLRRDFIELLTYARQLGFQVVIYTNGLKLSSESREQIAALHPASVEISIYSADAAQHDALTRVPGSFEKSMQSLDFFRSAGIRTTFKSSLTRGTIGNWQETQALGERSADIVILNPMISPGVDGKQAPLSVAAEFGELVLLAAMPGSPIYVGGVEQQWGRADLPARNKKPCGAGHGSIAITPEGKVYPCIAFPMVIGNFRRDGLQPLKRLPSEPAGEQAPNLTAATPAELLDQWRSIRMENMSDCGKYERCHYCGDLCPGDAFVQAGNPLRAAENHCRQAYARMTAGQLLRSGHSLDDLRKKFGIPAEFGRCYQKTRPTIRLHPIR
ncbi:MAG: hypothetical protein RLY71_2292 [Pseudomonadota bacterium]